MRLAFLGTPAFAVPPLRALLEAGHEIAAVYTQPPRPAGRGHRERRSAVHEEAAAAGLEVRCPRSLKPADAQQGFAALGLDAAVVVAYGLILPPPVLQAPRHGCLNIHASLLPRWRGAAPIQRAIEAGDAETGITIMQMDAGLDTGPILLQEAVAIGPADSAGRVHDRLAKLGARLIVTALERLDALTPRPQPADGVTYARKLERGEARLDWSAPADVLARRVRAFAPWPGASFAHDGAEVKVLAAEVAEVEGAPGTVLDAGPTVACGAGALRLLRLQRAGRQPMDGPAFLRGYPLPPGTVLE